MKLSLVIPVINHREETESCLKSFRETATNWQDIEVLIIDNGSIVPVREWGLTGLTESNFIRNEQNIGVLPALQQGYEHTTGDYILYTHNDVTMYEAGWDEKVARVLDGVNAGLDKSIGVAGFFAAKGLGTSDLYTRPYQMHQLIRIENVSGCSRMPAAHGYRGLNMGEQWERVAVMDGFSLTVSRKFLDENGGFDLNLPPHHMYDNHTCLQALDLGYINIVIAMDALHHGGVTDVNEPWNEAFNKSKAEIHADAHYPYFYNYWSPTEAEKRREQGKVGLTLPYYV